MKIASSHTTSIHLPGLTALPDEFMSIPATKYHHLILLHARYRTEVEAIATNPPLMQPVTRGLFFGMSSMGAVIGAATQQPTLDTIRKGTPLNY
jgi:hypothetical protein